MERIAELGRVGGWSVDPLTGKFNWSNELYRIHGVDRETFEVTSESWTALVHPDDVEVAGRIAEAISSPDSDGWHLRRRIVRPDGAVRVLDGRGQVDRDADGNAIKVTGYDQDVTELAALSEERRRSEELLARTAELGSVGGWECDVPTTYFKWSAEQYRIHGVDPETFEVNEASWHTLIHPDDLERSNQIVVDAIMDPSADGWEYRRRIVRPDGEVRIVLGRGHILRDENGDPQAPHRAGPGHHRARRRRGGAAAEREDAHPYRRARRVGGWVLELATGKMTWSAEQYRLYGLDPETFVPSEESWATLIHPRRPGAGAGQVRRRRRSRRTLGLHEAGAPHRRRCP